jgi:hypothetical protein
MNEHHLRIKSKAIPVTGRGGTNIRLKDVEDPTLASLLGTPLLPRNFLSFLFLSLVLISVRGRIEPRVLCRYKEYINW